MGRSGKQADEAQAALVGTPWLDFSPGRLLDPLDWENLKKKATKTTVKIEEIRLHDPKLFARTASPAAVQECSEFLAGGWKPEFRAIICPGTPDEGDCLIPIEGTHRLLACRQGCANLATITEIPAVLIQVPLTLAQRRAASQCQNLAAHRGRDQSFLDTLITFASAKDAYPGISDKKCLPGLRESDLNNVIRYARKCYDYPRREPC